VATILHITTLNILFSVEIILQPWHCILHFIKCTFEAVCYHLSTYIAFSIRKVLYILMMISKANWIIVVKETAWQNMKHNYIQSCFYWQWYPHSTGNHDHIIGQAFMTLNISNELHTFGIYQKLIQALSIWPSAAMNIDGFCC
jgi:hypothetical protein